MARCVRCNRFMLFKSASGYCNDCNSIIQEEKKRILRREELFRREDEDRKQQEECREKALEEQKRKDEEAHRKSLEEQKRVEEEKKVEREKKIKDYLDEANKRFQEGLVDDETLSAINNVLFLASVDSEAWQTAQNLLTDVKAEIDERNNYKKYVETVDQYKSAVTISQLEAVRESFAKLAANNYRDSQKKADECDKKIREQLAIIEEKHRQEKEERKRIAEEERLRVLEKEKTVDMAKCSIHLPFSYEICFDLRNKGSLLIKDKDSGKSYCIIKEISISDEYLERYFDPQIIHEHAKDQLRYQYAEDSVKNDPFCIVLGKTEWMETSVGRVMIIRIEKINKQRFYSCIIFFDELEFVFEFYPENYDPTTDLQTISHVLSTIRYGSVKESGKKAIISQKEATNKAEAWMEKSENLGTLYFFSMWLSTHDVESLREQMIIKFREKGVLTEDEIDVVDYSYLIRQLM